MKVTDVMTKGMGNNRAVLIHAFTACLGMGLAWALPAGAQTVPAAAGKSAPSENAPLPAAAGEKAPSENAPLPAAAGEKAPSESAALPAAVGEKAPVALPAVPKRVIEALLAGSPQGLEEVRKFLTGDNPQAQVVIDRSEALVRAVRETTAGQDPQQFLAVSARISGVAKGIFQSASIGLDIEAKIFAQAVNLTEPPKAGKPVAQSLQSPQTPGPQAQAPAPPNAENPVDVVTPPDVQPASPS